jgi:hypothetical protein
MFGCARVWFNPKEIIGGFPQIVVEEVATIKTLEEQKIEETIRKTPQNTFTVLDFIQVFRVLYAEDWKRLKERLGQFGEKRRYTVNTYLSNRLDLYSQKIYSLLRPFTRYSQGKFKDRRRPTKEEQKQFGSPWISVFNKKQPQS